MSECNPYAHWNYTTQGGCSASTQGVQQGVQQAMQNAYNMTYTSSGPVWTISGLNAVTSATYSAVGQAVRAAGFFNKKLLLCP